MSTNGEAQSRRTIESARRRPGTGRYVSSATAAFIAPWADG